MRYIPRNDYKEELNRLIENLDLSTVNEFEVECSQDGSKVITLRVRADYIPRVVRVENTTTIDET